jgi:hypothetical protein
MVEGMINTPFSRSERRDSLLRGILICLVFFTGLASGCRLHPKKSREANAAHTFLALYWLGAAALNVCPP